MKGDSIIKKIIFSSFFLAGIPSIIIITLLPPLGTRSRLEVEPVDKAYSPCIYADLNSDTVSEVIRSGKGLPYYHILILDNDMRVYDQWNLPDSMDLDMADLSFGNFDHDRYKEIYIFTYHDDSLFLNINEYFDPAGIKSVHNYITKIRVINKEITSIVKPAGFFDTNADGTDELFFSIQTGFGVDPRHLYSFDIVRKELKSSQLTGEICQFPKMADADGDGRPEIFGTMGASGNSNTWYPYSDWSAWLMVFNDSLKFKFPPVEFPGLTNQLEINALTNDGFKGYLVLYNTGSADTSVIRPRIMTYSLKGNKVRERLFSDLGLNIDTHSLILKKRNKERIYLLGNELLELNDQLEIIKTANSPFNLSYWCYTQDLDFDGEEELLLHSQIEEKIVIYNAELKKIAEAKLKFTERLRFSNYSSRSHVNKISVNAGPEYSYFLRLKGNNFNYLGFLGYPFIYFLVFCFIILIKKINTLQVVQKESLNRRLVNLQLQGIKSQLDPHFTFNTLNSIASLIYIEDRHLAYDYMNKFTQLLRSLINDAERIYRSLGEELEFVTTYLDLEKLRFGDKFNYSITIGEGVSQREAVPKLVLHTFAENAIKHGINSLSEGGILKISAVKKDDYLILSVEDNGIGRAQAEGQSKSTGKGLRLTGEFYDILNQLNKKPVKHFINDLYNDEGESAGTRVEVWVPVD